MLEGLSLRIGRQIVVSKHAPPFPAYTPKTQAEAVFNSAMQAGMVSTQQEYALRHVPHLFMQTHQHYSVKLSVTLELTDLLIISHDHAF